MSDSRDPLTIAREAERDLNSNAAKTGQRSGQSDSVLESGVDESAASRFGGTVTYGSAASGAGDNRDIPESEGGGENPATGRSYKARDFEGEGGPEDKAAQYAEDNPGADDARTNVRQ